MVIRRVLVLNGPNLDMLGMREPEIYGQETLGNLEYEVRRYGESLGIDVKCYQSNSEGKLIGKIHSAVGKYDGIVYNPGAHTHYSYALRDAVASVDVPVVEVHLSDIENREEFRRISVIAPVCIAQVKGMGIPGYCRAIDILCDYREGSPKREASEIEASESAGLSLEGAGAAAVKVGDAHLPPVDPGFAMGVECEPPSFVDPAQTSANRLAATRRACEQVGLAALLVRETSNVQWLTAFDGVFDEERAHALLVSPEGAQLHTDSRYSNALRTAVQACASGIAISDDRVSHPQFAYNALTHEGASALAGMMGIEDTITYAEFVKMVEQFTTARLAPTTDLVRGLRAVKDADEIARLRAAQAVTDATFLHIINFMKPGMTEREVQLELESYLLRHGAEGLAFRSIVATGANGADPHAIPGATRLEAGQCVVMDFGAKVRGYCSDMTRTVFLGAPEGAMADAWEVLRQANETVEAHLRPGVTGVEAHKLAEQVLEEGGFGGKMGHGLGHGVGIDVHELPALNPRNEQPLAEGNVVTVEPGIYLPGEFGMRLEDFGVVTANGFDVFTQSTHETVII